MANVTVSNDEELPTFLNISLSWSDDQPDVHMDLKEYTAPGTSGSVSKTIERTITQSGTYDVTLVVTNLVSQISLTKQVSSIPPEHTVKRVRITVYWINSYLEAGEVNLFC